MNAIAVLAAHAGWLETSWSPWLVLFIATILGIMIGGIVKAKIWFAVGLMGAVAGFFMGLLLFGIFAAATTKAD